MITVTVTTEIDVPAAEVFDYLADVTKNPEWQVGVVSTAWTSGSTREVGARYDQTLEYKGMVTSYRIAAIEQGKTMTVETYTGATIPTTVTRTVQPLSDSGCRVDVELRGELSGWRLLTRRSITRAIRKSIATDYRRLKELLEDDDNVDMDP